MNAFQGAICLDTLSSAWSPVLTIKSALLSLQSLLSTPEPKDPQDAEVAGMLTRNPREFERVAHEWAVKYASAPKKDSGEGSGGNKLETKKEKKQRSKEEERAERARLYDSFSLSLPFHTFSRFFFDVAVLMVEFQVRRIQRGNDQRIRAHGL